MEAGQLEMIVGGMFSGKSTELQRRGRRHEIAGRTVIYFKPKIDNRYRANSISTHDGSDVEANVVNGSRELVHVSRELNADVVCIDEVQFFDNKIVSAINLMLMDGRTVICAGLDVDRFGQPFGKVPELLCIAEEVLKLKAVCSSCGDDAWVSASKFNAEEQIVVGEQDLYVPMCRTCYYEKAGLI